MCFHLSVESQKQSRRTNITKQKKMTHTENKLVVTRGQKVDKKNEGGEGK